MVPYPAPHSFPEFYDLMSFSRTVRLRIVRCALTGRIARHEAERLRAIRDALVAMPRDHDEQYRLLPTSAEGPVSNTGLSIRIDYELEELDRDIHFADHGSGAVEELIAAAAEPGPETLRESVGTAVEFIEEAAPSAFVTDRDGTVNNYCDRYRSSVQSAYNAHWLARFSDGLSGPMAILTAAPLTDGGLFQLTTMPVGSAIYAGSKGREFITKKGRHSREPLPSRPAAALEELNRQLDELLSRPRYAMFRLIGSGYQQKVGETVVAYQTASGAIPRELAQELATEVASILERIDPEGSYLEIGDTGRDLEITTRNDSGDGYDKGDGIRYLDRAVPLDLQAQDVVVCGDTRSDLPMFEAVSRLSRSAGAVLVSTDRELIAAARSLSLPLCVVPSPDALVLALNAVADRRA